jgi:hypothetical protein
MPEIMVFLVFLKIASLRYVRFQKLSKYYYLIFVSKSIPFFSIFWGTPKLDRGVSSGKTRPVFSLKPELLRKSPEHHRDTEAVYKLQEGVRHQGMWVGETKQNIIGL